MKCGSVKPSVWGVTLGIWRAEDEKERIRVLRRIPAKVLSLLARQTCRVSARCCGIPCAFWFVSQVASSENFCWVHAVGG